MSFLKNILSKETISFNQNRESGSVVKKVVILGNSIVRHAPAENIGWHNNWGMAASSIENDFVHLLKAKMHEIDSEIEVLFENIAAFETDYEKYDLTLLNKFCDADLLIIRISENVPFKKGMKKKFFKSLDLLLDYLTPSKKTEVVMGEGFWKTDVNILLREYTDKRSIPFVLAEDLLIDDESNAAFGLFEDDGVARHPSDKGMRNIADRIWKSISVYFVH